MCRLRRSGGEGVYMHACLCVRCYFYSMCIAQLLFLSQEGWSFITCSKTVIIYGLPHLSFIRSFRSVLFCSDMHLHPSRMMCMARATVLRSWFFFGFRFYLSLQFVFLVFLPAQMFNFYFWFNMNRFCIDDLAFMFHLNPSIVHMLHCSVLCQLTQYLKKKQLAIHVFLPLAINSLFYLHNLTCNFSYICAKLQGDPKNDCCR